VIARENQVLLSFLKVRVIVNSREIFPLLNDQPVIIAVEDDHPKIVVTDGYHFTPPLELEYHEPSYYHFKVTCLFDDLKLLGGFFILALFYLLGFFTGIFILKLFSFLPFLWFFIFYFINRKEFIRISRG